MNFELSQVPVVTSASQLGQERHQDTENKMEPFGRAVGFDLLLVAERLTHVMEDADTEENVRKYISETRDVVHRLAGIWANCLTGIMKTPLGEIKEITTKLRDTHVKIS